MRTARLAALAAVAAVVAMLAGANAQALDVNQDKFPPDAEQNSPYEYQVEAEEGCLPYRFSFSSGTLPPGLKLSVDGLISGTPTVAGIFAFYIAVDDSNVAPCTGSPQSQGYFEIEVLPDLAVATTSLPASTPGTPYTTTLTASNVEQGWDVLWTVQQGSLPPGLSLAEKTGVISGTPSAAGTSTFTVRVREPFRRSGDRQLTIVVAPALVVEPIAFGPAEVTAPYTHTLVAKGGVAPLTWKLASGTLPATLVLDPTTGVVHGVPVRSGAYPLVFMVTDGAGAQRSVGNTLRIAPRLTVATTRLAPGRVGRAYASRLLATGGVRPASWRVARGVLPPGLRLNRATGRITGTPRAAATTRVTFRATDRLGVSATRTFSLVVKA